MEMCAQTAVFLAFAVYLYQLQKLNNQKSPKHRNTNHKKTPPTHPIPQKTEKKLFY